MLVCHVWRSALTIRALIIPTSHSSGRIQADDCADADQAVTWWERAAHDAQEKGIDPSEALRLFQRADEIAAILKASYRARSHTQSGNASSWPGHGRSLPGASAR